MSVICPRLRLLLDEHHFLMMYSHVQPCAAPFLATLCNGTGGKRMEWTMEVVLHSSVNLRIANHKILMGKQC